MSENPGRLLPRPSASGDHDSAGSPDHDHRSQQDVDQRTDTTHVSNVGRKRQPASESTVFLPPMRLHPPQGSTAQRPPTSSQGRSQDPPHYQPQSSGDPRRLLPRPSASGVRDSADLPDHDHRSRRGNQPQPSTSSQGRSQDPPHYQPQSSGPALIGTAAQLETHRAMRLEVALQQSAVYVSPYGSTQPDIGEQKLQPMTKQRPRWTDGEILDLKQRMGELPYASGEQLAEALDNGHDADDCRDRREALRRKIYQQEKARKARAKQEADRKAEDKPSGKTT